MDFIYNHFNFACDAYLENSLVKIDFIDRDCKILVGVQKKVKVALEDSLSLVENIKINLASVIKNIDGKYEIKVTVVVPVYNREKLIESCVNSIKIKRWIKEPI